MEFLGTKGKWVSSNRSQMIVDEKGYGIAQITGITNASQWQANVELIAEAGNIRQQIPFSLTELKKQRDEMLEFIKNYYKYLNLADQKVAEKLIKKATELN